MEHRLVNDTLVVERGDIVAHCVCGWSSGPRFTSMAASALFHEHQEDPSKPPPPDLYQFAKDLCHEKGMTWTDPRTGESFPPPGDKT
jgi:hypothetical protein